MKKLLHPFLIPFYTFAFFMELERQSYSINIIIMLLILGSAICATAASAMFSREIGRRSADEHDPLTDPEAGLRMRITMAAFLALCYGAETYMLTHPEFTYNWGARYIFAIYIIPAILNIFSGNGLKAISPRLSESAIAQMCLAPYTFIGSASGFVIMVGHKTSTDTTLPFIIALVLFTLMAYLGIANNSERLSGTICGYLLGMAQAIIAMFIFA